MNLRRVQIDQIKGITTAFDIEKPCVAIIGDMGTGKSAVLDGINLGLNLPTMHGVRDLDRLSPTGRWSTVLLFDDPNVQRLERRMERRGSQYHVNGRRVTSKEYTAAVKEILDVEPHHASLHEFLGLSGQRRAELFAQILESSTSSELANVINDQRSCTLDQLFENQIGVSNMDMVRGAIAELRDISGTTSELTEAIRQKAIASAQRERDAKTRHEGLIDKNKTLGHGMTPMDIQSRLSAIDGKLGALRDRQKSIEVERDRYDSSQAVLASAKATEEKLRDELQKVEADSRGWEESKKAADILITVIAEKDMAVKARQEEIEALGETSVKIDREISEIREGQRLVVEVVERPWDIDVEQIDVLWRRFLHEIRMQPIAMVDHDEHEYRQPLIDLAKSLVSASLGGSVDMLAERLSDAESREAANQEQLQAAVIARNEATGAMKQAELVADKAKEDLVRIEKAIAELPKAKKAVEDAESERASLEQSSQRIAVPEDDELLATQIDEAIRERAGLVEQQRELSEHNAIAGQIEQARVDVVAAMAINECMKSIQQIVQEWRDSHVATALAEVMEPFERRFRLLFDEEVRVGHRSSGTGRSTEFEFTVSRRGVQVPLDLLSDGEGILAAAAFLSALQTLKDTPGSILTINDIGLDYGGVDRFLTGAPDLGLDFVALATSRWREGADPDIWQVVAMQP